MPQPATVMPQPTTGKPQPATVNPQPATVMPQPATVKPQPATVMPQPATVMPQPATVMPQPATGKPQPATVMPQPATVMPQPATGKPQPATVNPQPATVMPQPATVKPQPATIMPQPATVMPQPATVKTKASAANHSATPQRTAYHPISMNNEGNRGFQLYSQHHAARLRMLGPEAALADWDALQPWERIKWTRRADEVAACVDPPSPKKGKKKVKRPCRNVTLEQRRMDFRPMQQDEEDEDEMGVPTVLINEEAMEQEMNRKYDEDKRLVEQAIMSQTGGCLDKIRRLRFLLASVQTFGNVDDVCMMAEFAMNEFNLRDGVVDRLSTVVGPWTVENEIQRSRAMFHSNETHRIPLQVNTGCISMRDLIVEVLGRTEPAIAARQGVRVGLYREELEDPDERTSRLFAGDINMNHVVDGNNRRWIICLRQEYFYLMASLKHLRDTVGLVYEGFPCSSDRFILADAFVDAVAKCLDGKPQEETGKWLAALGTHLPEEFATPWERSGELFCSRHRSDRNSCCATVTASRASFIVLHALEELLK